MKLKVDIAEEIQEQEFENEEVFIGSDPSCDLFLDYEGIGLKHVRVFKVNHNYFAEDLNSGQETFIGSRLLEPGGKSQVSPDAPIELGGIYIYVEEDLKDLFHLNTTLSVVEETTEEEGNSLESIDDLLNNASISSGDDTELEALVNDQADQEEQDEEDEHEDHSSDLDLFANAIPDEDDIPEKFKEEPIINEKFKPNLFADSSISSSTEDEKSGGENSFEDDDELAQKLRKARSEKTGSRKINIKQQNEDRSRKLKIKTQTSKESTKKIKSKRIKNQVKSSTPTSQILGLKTIFVICALVIGTGYIYYTDIYLPKLNKISELSKKKVKTKISLITNPKIEKYSKLYKRYFESERCDEKSLKNQCGFIKGFYNPRDVEGSLVFQGQLLIGINEKNIPKILSQLKPNSDDEQLIKAEIAKNYSELFDFERFQASGNKAPYKEYEDKRDKQKHSLAFIRILMARKFSEIASVKLIHIFSFKEVEDEFEILDFLEVQPKIMAYKEELKASTLYKLRSIWLHNLSADAKDYVASFGHTSKFSYDNTILLQEMAQKNLVSYKTYLTQGKCNTDLTTKICRAIIGERKRENFEGAVIVDDRLLIYYQVDLIKARYKGVFNGDYSNIDKKNLMNLFIKTKNSQMSLGDFQRNNYTSKMSKEHIERDALLSEFVDSSYFQDIIISEKIKKVALIGVDGKTQGGGMKLALEVEMKYLNRVNQETLVGHLPYFWKNQVPIFGAITNNLINYTTY